MLFVVIATDKPNSLGLRMATREAHFAYARETGVIKLGGPFLNENGYMIGSLIIIEASDILVATVRVEAEVVFVRRVLKVCDEVVGERRGGLRVA